jgi:hypothetical protein
MAEDQQRPLHLGVEDAARIIYGTQQPDFRQVGQVRAMILRGVIRGSEDGRWTTAEAVAEYLAAANLRQRAAETERRASGGEAPVPRGSSLQRQYRTDYRAALRDYFLAVIYRRDRRRYSRPFQRAVVAGQIVLLAGMLALVALAFYSLRPVAEPRELTAVRAWLKDNTTHYHITQWHPPQPTADGERSSIRVIYEYSQTSRKTIRTDRVFVIEGSRVVSVESGE